MKPEGRGPRTPTRRSASRTRGVLAAVTMVTARRRAMRASGADALVACGATLLLLSAPSRATMPIVAGFALVLLGAGLLWGVPPPPLRVRGLAAMAGLLVGFTFARLM